MIEYPTQNSFKDYIKFWSGQLFSLLGSVVIQFVLIWWIERKFSSVLYLSLASFFYILPLVVFMPLGGVLSDRFDKGKLIFTVDALQAFVTLILIILFSLGIKNIWVIFFFIAIRSCFQAIHQPTVSSVIPSMVPKNKLSRINGLNFLFSGFIQLLGPALGGLLYLFIPLDQILWLDIVTFLIAIIPLFLIKIPKVREINESDKLNIKSFFKDLKEGVKILKLIPGLFILIAASVFINFLLRPLTVLLVHYVHQIHGGLELEISVISVLLNAGGVFGAIITTSKKKWNKKILTMVIGIIFIGIGYALLAFIPRGFFILIGINLFGLGIIFPVINTIYQTILQISVPQDKIGRVSSIDMALSMMVSPIGTIISGPIAIVISVETLFLICGILIAILMGSAYLFTNIRKVKFEDDNEEKIDDVSISSITQES